MAVEVNSGTGVLWSVDVPAVHAFGVARMNEDVVLFATGADTEGHDYLECRDLTSGVGWRAHVADPASGRWAQDVWALSVHGGADGWYDPDVSRLALPVAMLDAPTRRLTHRPEPSGRAVPDATRVYSSELSAGRPRTAADGVATVWWDLWEAADVVRWLAPWEARFGLTHATMRHANGDIAFAQARYGPYRLSLTRVALGETGSWVLTITDLPDEGVGDAETRWIAAVHTEHPTLGWTAFLAVFTQLLVGLHPVDGEIALVPPDLRALADR